jgi:hypothetical protein
MLTFKVIDGNNRSAITWLTISKYIFWRRKRVQMPYEGHMTISEMAQEFNASVDRLRTIIARERIQPVRFPHDMRLLYYKTEDIERIKRILDIKRG